jgi:hypothetical protein
MASLVLSGDTSGSITVSAPAVSGSTTQTLVNVTGTLAPVVSGTAQASTSGTSIDFTSIPSWVKRITVMLSGVSTNGTSNILVQLGDSGGVETTGYVSQANTFNAAPGSTASTAGFLMLNTTVAAISYSGVVPICNLNGNDWVTSGVLVASTAAQGVSIFGGIKTLSATLDRIRITTVNGTDTFDAGTINILYE